MSTGSVSGIAAAGERTYTITEVAALWKTSRDTVRRLIDSAELRSVQVGARRRIPSGALEEYIDRQRA